MNVKTSESKQWFRLLAYFFSIVLLGSIAFVKPLNHTIEKVAYKAPALRTLQQSTPEFKGFELVSKTRRRSKIVGTGDKDVVINHELAPTEILTEDSIPEMEFYHPIVVRTQFNASQAPVDQLISAANVEVREFSIPEKPVAEIPVDAIVEQFPFVPRSSFSHYNIEDTSKPRFKIDTEKERTARESLEKAQKAIENLDWEQIQHLLKNNADITKIRKEIQHALAQLNWQKINQEVSDKINAEALAKMKASLKVEYDQARDYKNQLQEYKIIEGQLKLQKEIFKKDADIKLNEIRKEVSKRKAVVDI